GPLMEIFIYTNNSLARDYMIQLQKFNYGGITPTNKPDYLPLSMTSKVKLLADKLGTTTIGFSILALDAGNIDLANYIITLTNDDQQLQLKQFKKYKSIVITDTLN